MQPGTLIFLFYYPSLNVLYLLCLLLRSLQPQIPQLQYLGAHVSSQIRPSLYFLWSMLPPQTGSSSRIEITNDSVTT